MPSGSAKPRNLSDHGMDLLGADDRRPGKSGHLGLTREPDEAAAAEARQPIAFAIQLADALEPFGEHGDQLAARQHRQARSPSTRGRSRRARRRWPSTPERKAKLAISGRTWRWRDARGGCRASASRRRRGCRRSGCRPAARRRRRGRSPCPAAARGSSCVHRNSSNGAVPFDERRDRSRRRAAPAALRDSAP